MAIDDIAQVEGLDMIVEGAADLSQSLGIPWQTRDDQVTSHVQHIFEIVNAHGKHFVHYHVKMKILQNGRHKVYKHLF